MMGIKSQPRNGGTPAAKTVAHGGITKETKREGNEKRCGIAAHKPSTLPGGNTTHGLE